MASGVPGPAGTLASDRSPGRAALGGAQLPARRLARAARRGGGRGAPASGGRCSGSASSISLDPLRPAGRALIAGGGLAGAAAACRLAQQGQAVTLFERGARGTAQGLRRVHQRRGAQPSRGARAGSGGPRGGSHRARPHREPPFPRRLRAAVRRQQPDPAAGSMSHCCRMRGRAGADIRLGRVVAPRRGQLGRFHSARTGRRRAPGRGARAARYRASTNCAAHGDRPPREAQVCFKSYFFAYGPEPSSPRGACPSWCCSGTATAACRWLRTARANLCLLTTNARLVSVGGTWSALLAALLAESRHLRDRLQGAEERLERPLTIAQVPYGFLYRAPHGRNRATCSGLATRVAGDPLVQPATAWPIALHTATQAAQSMLVGEPAAIYHDRMRRTLRPQMRMAGGLYAMGRTAPGPGHVAAGRPALARPGAGGWRQRPGFRIPSTGRRTHRGPVAGR